MTSADPPGYRRRILIEPGAGRVVAELEDDFHAMRVALAHADGLITGVDGEMMRRPWTTCPGAIAQLNATFLGRALTDGSVRDAQRSNCTHLFDLALFAAAHAGEAAPVAYDIAVSDPVDGQVVARLWKDGALLLDWGHDGAAFTTPAEIAGMPLGEARSWIAAQPRAMREPMRILRWASRVALGRGVTMPEGSSATRFATGVCHSFQPEIAKDARRLGGDVDFTARGTRPMAAREGMFVRQA
jgi:hypothetical protein